MLRAHLAALAVLGCLGATTAAAEDEPRASRMRMSMQSVLAYTAEGLIGDSLFNPGNAIAQRPPAQLSLELRPDFELKGERFALTARPRVRLGVLYGNASRAEQDSANDAYLNTWKLKVGLTPTLSVSYGREVLQWGNSTFRSPSNPFFIDTGKLNPVTELYGKDFLAAAYTPSPALSFTLLANTGAGRREQSVVPFERTVALKADYVGTKASSGLITSRRQGSSLRVGGYLTYTVSDAMLLYAETTLARGGEGFYPQRATGPIGWSLQQSARDSNELLYSHLLGATYSLEGGTTFTLEYLHNNEGYDRRQARDFRALGVAARAELAAGGPQAATAASLLGGGLDPNLRVLRQDYVFLQCFVGEYRDRADLAVRYAHSVADRSGSLSTSITVDAGARAQLFFIGSYNRGAPDADFARLHRYTLFLGLRYFPF